jgi:uncharacterized protein GlcG (DUF336 family)
MCQWAATRRNKTQTEDENIMHVTIADAEVAIDAARKRAAELGTQMCIAIVDS